MVAEHSDERFLLRGENLSAPLDFQSLFGRPCPVEVEIGVGKGRFLLGQAAQHPEIGFLGIERSHKYLRITLERLNRSSCENVRLVCDDAGFFVRTFIPEHAVSKYHIYFPDPWPKKRHHKRRLINPNFAGFLFRTLSPGGEIRVATDHLDYFQEIVRALDSVDRWERKELWSEPARATEAFGATHYEIKYAREGRTVHHLSYMAHNPHYSSNC